MPRLLLICALALLGAASLRSSPGFALAAADAAAAASVKLRDCASALEPEERSATFEARMRSAHGSERMQVRFTLQVREGVLPGWRRVVADGLDEWQASEPGVTRYSYSQTVRNLSAPAAYRTVVRFRWLDAAGDVIERSRATSRICRQPDMRPDLRVTLIDATDGGYTVALRNAGRSAAGPFSVALTAGDAALEPLALDGMEAGEQRFVTVAGPACEPGEPLTATADGGDAVDERDEDDNVLVAACPP
jgi:hypothetical protein